MSNTDTNLDDALEYDALRNFARALGFHANVHKASTACALLPVVKTRVGICNDPRNSAGALSMSHQF